MKTTGGFSLKTKQKATNSEFPSFFHVRKVISFFFFFFFNSFLFSLIKKMKNFV